MEVITLLYDSFISIVTTVTVSGRWLCLFVIAAFICALIFNFIHLMIGGK